MDGNLAYRTDERREFRMERIDGRAVMMSSPSMNHYYVTENLYRIFSGYLRGKPCRAYFDCPTVHFSDRESYVPDMMVLCDRSKVRYDGIYGAPDLVAEVLSPSSVRYDRGQKMKIYEQFGVKEYWIVDPKGKSVEQYLLRDGQYVLRGVYAILEEQDEKNLLPEEKENWKTAFPCGIFPDLEISIDEVFYDMIE